MNVNLYRAVQNDDSQLNNWNQDSEINADPLIDIGKLFFSDSVRDLFQKFEKIESIRTKILNEERKIFEQRKYEEMCFCNEAMRCLTCNAGPSSHFCHSALVFISCWPIAILQIMGCLTVKSIRKCCCSPSTQEIQNRQREKEFAERLSQHHFRYNDDFWHKYKNEEFLKSANRAWINWKRHDVKSDMEHRIKLSIQPFKFFQLINSFAFALQIRAQILKEIFADRSFSVSIIEEYLSNDDPRYYIHNYSYYLREFEKEEYQFCEDYHLPCNPDLLSSARMRQNLSG